MTSDLHKILAEKEAKFYDESDFEFGAKIQIDMELPFDELQELRKWCIRSLQPEDYHFTPCRPALQQCAVFYMYSPDAYFLFKLAHEELIGTDEHSCIPLLKTENPRFNIS